MKNTVNILIILLLFGAVSSNALAEESQNLKKFSLIDSYDAEFLYGSGGGSLGLGAKFNHWLIDKNKWKIQAALMLSTFYTGEAGETKNSSYDDLTLDTHLQFHFGFEKSFFSADQFYVLLETYLGFYNYYNSGSYKNDALKIDREYSVNEFLFDFGTRLGLGYRIKSKWGIQMSLTNSWRQVQYDYGLLMGQPDAKLSLGLGLNYRFNGLNASN